MVGYSVLNSADYVINEFYVSLKTLNTFSRSEFYVGLSLFMKHTMPKNLFIYSGDNDI